MLFTQNKGRGWTVLTIKGIRGHCKGGTYLNNGGTWTMNRHIKGTTTKFSEALVKN